MLNRFRFSPRAVMGLLLLTAVLLTGCGKKGSASWAGVSSDPDGARVYVAYEKRVVALNAQTGEQIWSYRDKKHEDATFFAISYRRLRWRCLCWRLRRPFARHWC